MKTATRTDSKKILQIYRKLKQKYSVAMSANRSECSRKHRYG